MTDELLEVELRLERAHEHIHALNHEARMFMMSRPQPYNMITEPDPHSFDYITRAKIDRLPPPRLGMVVTDAVHNLRAALDMIAWKLALKGPNPPPDEDTSVAFPICTTPEAWESRRTQGMIERIPEDAIKAIKAFQPYSTPDGLVRLRFLQSLDNWSKHKTVPNLFSFHVSRIRPIPPSGNYLIVEANLGNAFEDGDVIFRVRPTPPYPQ